MKLTQSNIVFILESRGEEREKAIEIARVIAEADEYISNIVADLNALDEREAKLRETQSNRE
jgi:hypothetical protein